MLGKLGEDGDVSSGGFVVNGFASMTAGGDLIYGYHQNGNLAALGYMLGGEENEETTAACASLLNKYRLLIAAWLEPAIFPTPE